MAEAPVFNDTMTEAWAASIAHLADGVRVRVLSSQCQRCREIYWPFGEGEAWTVAAAVLRELATQWHDDDCPGPVQFATEPVDA